MPDSGKEEIELGPSVLGVEERRESDRAAFHGRGGPGARRSPFATLRRDATVGYLWGSVSCSGSANARHLHPFLLLLFALSLRQTSPASLLTASKAAVWSGVDSGSLPQRRTLGLFHPVAGPPLSPPACFVCSRQLTRAVSDTLCATQRPLLPFITLPSYRPSVSIVRSWSSASCVALRLRCRLSRARRTDLPRAFVHPSPNTRPISVRNPTRTTPSWPTSFLLAGWPC